MLCPFVNSLRREKEGSREVMRCVNTEQVNDENDIDCQRQQESVSRRSTHSSNVRRLASFQAISACAKAQPESAQNAPSFRASSLGCADACFLVLGGDVRFVG